MKKVILFLWFGDEKPPYIQWTLENFRKMNPGWEIRYIEYTSSQILNYRDIGDDCLIKTIEQDKTNPGWCPQYMNRIADSYRTNYLATHKDEFIIYCDLDCFPIAPFDNFILPTDANVPDWFRNIYPPIHIKPKAMGLMSNKIGKYQDIRPDTWCFCNNKSLLRQQSFLQLHKGSILDDTLIFYQSMFMNKSRIQDYLQRTKDFHKMKIELGDNFCLPLFTPIEHYYSVERDKLNKDVKPIEVKTNVTLKESFNNYIEKQGNDKKCLHIGCGWNAIDKWLNTDLTPNEEKGVFKLDVAKPFELPDNSFDYIYSSHMIEHLTYSEAKNLLKECYRVLKPNGVMRIACPMLDNYIELLRNQESADAIAYSKWYSSRFLKGIVDDFGNDVLPMAFILNAQLRKFGHKLLYDFKLMKLFLEKIGFTNVLNAPFRMSNHKTLDKLEYHEAWTKVPNCNKTIGEMETFCVEATKPNIAVCYSTHIVSRKEKLETLRKKDIINVAFLDSQDSWDIGQGIKSKLDAFKNKLSQHPRFNVIHTTIGELKSKYDDIDLYFPHMPYESHISNGDGKLYDRLCDDKKLVFVRYSLGWHTNIKFQPEYDKCLFAFVDGEDLKFKPHYVNTGHPYSEVLVEDKTKFKNMWKTDKKHILLCPHWTIKPEGSGKPHNKTSFNEQFEDMKYVISKYGNECEFVLRPHPNLYNAWKRGFSLSIYKDRDLLNTTISHLEELEKMIDIVVDNNQIDWFKYSDAMVHDGGSFRCEYLYVDKPVCYISNKFNCVPSDWSEMGKLAMECHEIIPEQESIEPFIIDVLNGNDKKKGERDKYKSKYIGNWPNGKPPTENIINCILGQEEYKGFIP